jgi:SpoVK/Ycf46/Vps4 family AAA+-type ATPase
LAACSTRWSVKSESRVREALKLVDAMAPCVLMIDEADKAFAGQAGGGSSGDSGVGMRVLGAILTWMQETKSPVFVVVTANRVQNLPTEFLRRGRLDEIFSVSVPNEKSARKSSKSTCASDGKDPSAVPNLEALRQGSAGYVAAELEAAVKDAIIEAFVRKQPLTGELIAAQFENMVPISEAFKEDFEGMQVWATNNARPASRDASGSTAPRRRARRTAIASKPGAKRAAEFADAAGLDG